MILVEPEALLTESSKLPGLDGQKMSKSYNNTIALREDAESVNKKIRTMPTDPARVKRSDPGDPDKCPVWQFHLVYSDDKTRAVGAIRAAGRAGIGCLECKQPVIDAVLAELAPMRERAQKYLDDPTLVRNIVADGCEKARALRARDHARGARGHGTGLHVSEPHACQRAPHIHGVQPPSAPARSWRRVRGVPMSRDAARTCTFRRMRWRSSSRPSRDRSTCCSTSSARRTSTSSTSPWRG